MHDSWKDLAYDEVLDNRELREQLKQLQTQLNEESRKRAMAEAELAIVRKDRDRQILNLEKQLRLLRVESVPGSCNDDDSEAECAECFTPIEELYTDKYCSNCGCKFDWKHYPEETTDEWEYDRAVDDRMYKAVS